MLRTRVATILQNHESLIAGSFSDSKKNLPIHELVSNQWGVARLAGRIYSKIC